MFIVDALCIGKIHPVKHTLVVSVTPARLVIIFGFFLAERHDLVIVIDTGNMYASPVSLPR